MNITLQQHIYALPVPNWSQRRAKVKINFLYAGKTDTSIVISYWWFSKTYIFD